MSAHVTQTTMQETPLVVRYRNPHVFLLQVFLTYIINLLINQIIFVNQLIPKNQIKGLN